MASAMTSFPLLDLPHESLVQAICSYLDSRSRIALCQTCKRLNAPTYKAWMQQLTDCSKGYLPNIVWPQDAPPIQALVMIGLDQGPDRTAQPHNVLGALCRGDRAQLVRGVTSLHLKGWALSPSMPLVKVLSQAFPSLSHLKLEGCYEAADMLYEAGDHLTHLTHLEVYLSTPACRHTLSPLPPHVPHLLALTRLSLVTPRDRDKWNRDKGTWEDIADLAPLAALVQLQQLELALPVTQLKFVAAATNPWLTTASGMQSTVQRPVWPHLQEAHVITPPGLLLDLGLASSNTAPILKRLYLTLLWPSRNTCDQAETTREATQALADCTALQQPLAIRGGYTIPFLQALTPLAGKLHHLSLSRTYSFRNDTTERLSALNALSGLTCLTLSGGGKEAAAEWAPLLAAQHQLRRVIIGLDVQSTGYGWWSVTPEAAQMWCGALTSLVGQEQQQPQLQGQQQQDVVQQVPQAFVACSAAAAVSVPGVSTSSAGCSSASPYPAPGPLQAQAIGGRSQGPPGARAATGAAATDTKPSATSTTATATATGAQALAVAPAPVHLYFGAWCPASRVQHNAVAHTPQYLKLLQLTPSNSAEAGRFLLHECDGGSALTMSLGVGAAWLEPHLNTLEDMWTKYERRRADFESML